MKGAKKAGVVATAIAAAFFAGYNASSRHAAQQAQSVTPGYASIDIGKDGRKELLSAEGVIYEKSGDELVRRGDMNRTAAGARQEILDALHEKNEKKLDEIRDEFEQGYIDAALTSIASENGFEEFRSKYSSGGIVTNLRLSLSEYAVISLAEIVRDRYNLIKKVEMERAEKSSVQQASYKHGDMVHTRDGGMYVIYAVDITQQGRRYAGYLNGKPGSSDRWISQDEIIGRDVSDLRKEFKNFPAEKLSEEEREKYKQLLNAQPENNYGQPHDYSKPKPLEPFEQRLNRDLNNAAGDVGKKLNNAGQELGKALGNILKPPEKKK